jgi:hypothetical protein
MSHSIEKLACLLAFACQPLPREPQAPEPRPAQPAAVSFESTMSGKGATPSGDPDITKMVQAVSAARTKVMVERLAGFGTRHSLSDQKSDTRGIGAAARYLQAELQQLSKQTGGRLEVQLQDFVAQKGPRVPKPWPMQNVVARLPGNDKKRVIVLTGHLDSRATDIMNAEIDAPGANDDASGVAAVMEACRVMATHHFQATIVCAAVSGEEQGLFGSKALVDQLKSEGLSIEAMFTNDIVGASQAANGRSDKRKVRVFSSGLPFDPKLRDQYLAVGGETEGPGRQLARVVEETSFRHCQGFQATAVLRFDRYLRGGDHRPFHEAGIAAVRLTEMDEDFRRQHQDIRTEAGVEYGDLAKFVDAEYVANVARVNVAAAATLARAPAPPKHVRLDVRGLDEDTTLLFVPDPTPGVSYQVMARPTRDWNWTRTFHADQSGKVRIPLSKDHWVFALRAIGPGGHASLAVFPLPLVAADTWPPAE